MFIEKTGVDRSALQGKVAVVTGAGQGIGKETARVLAYAGAAVVIAELNDSGAETERAIRAAGGRALFLKTDVSDPASMDRLQSKAHEAFGSVDILVNNAEAFKAGGILSYSVADWDRIIAVNLRGAFLSIRAFLPDMLHKGAGVIVTMESADAMPYMVPYTASKVALRAVAASLAAEVGEQSGVAVYCFGPSMVDTPGANTAFAQLALLMGMSLEEFIRQSAPTGKLTDPELVAVGLLGTILHAKEYHGMETAYVAGLDKLGLSADGEPLRNDVDLAPATALAGETRGRYEQALTKNRAIEEILSANMKEYDALSMFMRQWVKRDFQQRTGLKVEDWLAKAQTLSLHLESVLSSGPDGATARLGQNEVASYAASLERMASFITKQEADARGWIKDVAKLSVALAALAERKATVQALANALEQLHQN